MTDVIVETENGQLRGVMQRNFENLEYYAFKGVPYAKPPINELRFKDPEPVDNWSGVRDATEFGNMCIQCEPLMLSFVGSEDCLYLNIYTKSFKNSNELKPVMVFIYGGAFVFGSGSDMYYGPDYLIRKDIVLVTINYRLGIFGFLNLEDEICPGNQGLKDQIMALRWVQDNIQNFGGDPKNVTLFGESSGAACVHILALSPLAKGLFHKVICQSAVGINIWATIKEPKKFIYRLCTILGKYTRDPKQIYKFLKNLSSHKLVQAAEKVRRSQANSTKHQSVELPFIPSMDKFSQNPVMPIPIEEAALQGINMPFLLGCNSFEGTGFLLEQASFIPIKDSDYQIIDSNFHSCLHPQIKDVIAEYKMTINDLRHMYFGNKKITPEKWEALATLHGDVNYHHGIFKVVEIQVKHKSLETYLYRFSYDKTPTIMKSKFTNSFKGATHFDEISYLFYSTLCKKLEFPSLKQDARGYKVMQRMTEMWTNFATYGNPTPQITDLLPVTWEPVDNAVNIRLLNIDEELTMESCLHIDEKFKKFKSLES